MDMLTGYCYKPKLEGIRLLRLKKLEKRATNTFEDCFTNV